MGERREKPRVGAAMGEREEVRGEGEEGASEGRCWRQGLGLWRQVAGASGRKGRPRVGSE